MSITKHHLPTITERHFMPPIMGLGKQIAIARRGVKLSQGELGKLLSVGQSTVAQWETDKNEPALAKIEEIAKITGKPMSWFVGEKNAIKPQDESVSHENTQRMVVRSEPKQLRFAPGEAADWPRDLRVLGFVKAGMVGYYPDNGETLEMTELSRCHP